MSCTQRCYCARRRRILSASGPTRHPGLLAAGVTVERCHDLGLVHRTLRPSQVGREPSAIRAAEAWDTPLAPHVPERETGATLFDLEAGSERSGGVPQDIDEALAEFS